MTAWAPSTPLATVVDLAGFAYDPDQDIIYSRMDALQRQFGYAYSFDKFALLMAADIDCEPIFFEYGDAMWMIELWKGQYGLETGCEVGVYLRPNSGNPIYYPALDAAIGSGRTEIDPDVTHARFFACAAADQMLDISLSLTHKTLGHLFSRSKQKHWWLTGFKWGVYSQPDELSMAVTIGFPTPQMAAAFSAALQAMGHQPVPGDDNSVSFVLDEPKAVQPPRDETMLAAVRAEDKAIVATYRALGLPNNDPNQVAGEAANELVNLIVRRAPHWFGFLLTQALKTAGKDIQDITGLLVNDLELALAATAGWFADVGYGLLPWIMSVYEFFKSVFAQDDSCIVQIVNMPSGSKQPPLLTLKGTGITNGTWAIAPPAVIKPGETRRFQLKDLALQPGAEGYVDYFYVSPGGAQSVVRFSFACPFLFTNPNYARANSADFGIFGRTGEDPQWHSPVPTSGHPLSVAYTWAGGPPLAG
jgi:hypothetical protein